MSDPSDGLPVYLTNRALSDLAAIRRYTTAKWGSDKAKAYLGNAEAALSRISRLPGLLIARPDLHTSLRFYVMNEHIFVCDLSPTAIIVLTVLATRMDVVARLAILEPTFADEVALLARQIEDR